MALCKTRIYVSILDRVGDGLDVAADGLEGAEGRLVVVVGCGQGVSGVLVDCPAHEHGQVVVGNVGGLDGAVVMPGVGAVGHSEGTGRQGAGKEKG